MDTTPICSGCKKPLAQNAPQGLCPECLLKAGLGSGMDIGPDSQTASGRLHFVAPPVDEIARLFPQLEVLSFIGQGGMGAVYRARQKELDRVVALKILPPDIGQDPSFAERFTREARALAKLNHPGIVTLYEFGRADGLFFFLMEFVEGVNLGQLLAGGHLSSREAMAIVPQICEALQYAHDQGIVHRDIKPQNILVDRRGRVKVADFGLAKLAGSVEAAQTGEVNAPQPSLTEAGKVMGTPQYMAPEQRERPTEVDHRADIYSLGVVFYQMLTGELPGKTVAPPSKKVHVDVRLDHVVLRALEEKPERRYQQASQVKTDVETIAKGAGQGDQEPGLISQETKSWRRHFHVKAVCFFFGAVCFLIAAVSFFTEDENVLASLLSLFAVFGFSIAGYRYWQAAAAVPQSPSEPPPTPERERILREVRGPAIGLLVTGIFNWLAMPVVIGIVLGYLKGKGVVSPAPAIGIPLTILSLSSFLIYAALKMMRLEDRSVATAGPIIAALVTPGNIIGLPIGIWGLVTMTRPHVRAAFRPSMEPWFMPKWGMFLAVGLLGAYALHHGGKLLGRGDSLPSMVVAGQVLDAATDNPTNSPAQNAAHKFVRLVADQSSLTFQGQPTSWDTVTRLLAEVPNREMTVLEFAMASDRNTVARQNEWVHKANSLARQHGFKYASFIGIHPLGSKGTTQAPEIPIRAEQVSDTNFASLGFEVVALTSTPRAGMTWWRPDGKMLQESPGDKLGNLSGYCARGASPVELAVLVKRSQASGTERDFLPMFDPRPEYVARHDLLRGGEPAGQVAVVGFRTVPTNLTCRVASPDGDWERVATWDKAGTLLSNESGGKLQLVRSGGDNTMCMKLQHQVNPDRFAVRIAARLRDGQHRLAALSTTEYARDTESAQLCALLDGIQDDEVIAYELYRIPLRWTAIHGIETKPNVAPLPPLGGPLMEDPRPPIQDKTINLSEPDRSRALTLFNDIEDFGHEFEAAFASTNLAAAQTGVRRLLHMLTNFNATVKGTGFQFSPGLFNDITKVCKALEKGDWEEAVRLSKHNETHAREFKRIAAEMVALARRTNAPAAKPAEKDGGR